MENTIPTSVVGELEWRKANPISHGDFKGLDGDKAVARIYLAVSDISLNENWHWELTVEHDGLEADEVAGQAPSHIAAADAAERAYNRLIAGPDPQEHAAQNNALDESELVAEAVEKGSDA